MVCCYNTRSNDPYKESHHPGYTPLKKIDDSLIKKLGSQSSDEGSQSWLDPEKDESASGLDQG